MATSKSSEPIRTATRLILGAAVALVALSGAGCVVNQPPAATIPDTGPITEKDFYRSLFSTYPRAELANDQKNYSSTVGEKLEGAFNLAEYVVEYTCEPGGGPVFVIRDRGMWDRYVSDLKTGITAACWLTHNRKRNSRTQEGVTVKDRLGNVLAVDSKGDTAIFTPPPAQSQSLKELAEEAVAKRAKEEADRKAAAEQRAKAEEQRAKEETERKEREARFLLEAAKVFLDSKDKRDRGVERLQELVRRYPDTKAAAEARTILAREK